MKNAFIIFLLSVLVLQGYALTRWYDWSVTVEARLHQQDDDIATLKASNKGAWSIIQKMYRHPIFQYREQEEQPDA